MDKIKFSHDETMITGMALSGIIEDLTTQTQKMTNPFTPEARKYLSEMINAAKSAREKLEKITGTKFELPPYKKGDENEFLTKES